LSKNIISLNPGATIDIFINSCIYRGSGRPGQGVS